MSALHAAKDASLEIKEELAFNRELNVELDKRDLVLLNVKPAQTTLSSLLMENHARTAHLIKLPLRKDCAHSVCQDGPLLTKEPANNLKFNVDQDKRDSVILLVKPAQLILDFLQIKLIALDAQPIKLFHHLVSAHHAQLDKKLMPLETVVI